MTTPDLPVYRIHETPAARRDLTGILDYVLSVAPHAVGRTLGAISAVIESLAQLPRRYRIYRANRTPSRAVHVVPCGQFLIYYRVAARERSVYILMIRHGARQPPKRFPTR